MERDVDDVVNGVVDLTGKSVGPLGNLAPNWASWERLKIFASSMSSGRVLNRLIGSS